MRLGWKRAGAAVAWGLCSGAVSRLWYGSWQDAAWFGTIMTLLLIGLGWLRALVDRGPRDDA
ncbi:hypothetical protein ACGF7W_13035 [Streptomyces sp. NPDC048219]|uniref:hypothetical protein n=1 Tax=unclassified Streptomyces TaxID=2593676 RepID=UPI003424F42D